jgi:hypothetical protein
MKGCEEDFTEGDQFTYLGKALKADQSQGE